MAEEHFLKDIVEGLEPLPVEDRVRAWYDPGGDCLHFQTVDEAVIAQWVDPIFTIYRSALNNRPIGFQLKDVRALMDSRGADASAIAFDAQVSEDGHMTKLNLLWLLLVAFDSGKDAAEDRQERLQAYFEVMKQTPVQDQEIAIAA